MLIETVEVVYLYCCTNTFFSGCEMGFDLRAIVVYAYRLSLL